MRPRAIVGRLEVVIGVDGASRRLRDAIATELSTHFGLPQIRAAEEAEKLEPKVAALIGRTQSDFERRGLVPALSLVGASGRYVSGSCWIAPSDSPEISAAKLRRLNIDALHQAIRGLTFSQFEAFGARVIAELGAQTVRVTTHSSDQGLDFYGTLSLGPALGAQPGLLQLAHDVRLHFAGQAKHYPDRAVGPEVVRELVGAISLARYRVFSADTDLFDDLELQAFNPLLALLFTTGKFTRGAIELATRSGIVARSGEQLAVFLADRGVGMIAGPSGPVFNHDEFFRWLEA